MTATFSPLRSFTGLALSACLTAALFPAAPAAAGGLVAIHQPGTSRIAPWVEGVDPALENALFDATYRALPSHNVLKVYAFSAAGYESAGIRFSARVPHEARDLTEPEIVNEAAVLIRTAFEDFPSVQEVDVWGTVPVATSQMTSIENTVFSVSADRATYEQIRNERGLRNDFFLGAFGRVWFAPQVPR